MGLIPIDKLATRCQPYRTASFSGLPGLNFTVLLAAIWIVSPVWGLRPVRSGRSLTENTPNPDIDSWPSVCKLEVNTEIQGIIDFFRLGLGQVRVKRQIGELIPLLQD